MNMTQLITLILVFTLLNVSKATTIINVYDCDLFNSIDPIETSLTIRIPMSGRADITCLLDSIKAMTHLTELDISLYNNFVNDISLLPDSLKVLNNLTTLKLNFGRNKLIDISSLQQAFQMLPNLSILELKLGQNQINDISCLSSAFNRLINLKILDIQINNNEIVDISALQSSFMMIDGLENLKINFSENQIIDISSLSNAFQNFINLTTFNLSLSNNQISDISVVQTSFQALEKITKFYFLLNSNLISDISSLQSAFQTLVLTEELYINLSNNEIENIIVFQNSFSSLSKLTTFILFLQQNQINDIQYLQEAFRQQTLLSSFKLHLNNNQITDISVLSDTFQTLTSLNNFEFQINNNQINDIGSLSSAFQTLTNLELLDFRLDTNLINDVSALREAFKTLTNLTTLKLWIKENKLEIISPMGDSFKGTTNLDILIIDLFQNEIKDVNTLSEAFMALNKISQFSLRLDCGHFDSRNFDQFRKLAIIDYPSCCEASQNFFMISRQCQNCKDLKQNCISCSDPLTCTECENGYVLDSGECKLICDHNCATCETEKSNCLTCQGLNRKNDSPTCSCEDGYIDNGVSDCLKCHRYCSKCSNRYNICTECAGLNRSQGRCDCQYGYFENSDLECVPCQYPCRGCKSLTQCDSCAAKSMNARNETNCTCQQGYYEEKGTLECLRCRYPCQECVNQSDQCTVCHKEKNSQFTPSCQCKEGFYEDKISDWLRCQPCPKNCKRCGKKYWNSEVQCYECSDSIANLELPGCLCEGDDHFIDLKENSCETCKSPCQNCIDQNTCTSCIGEFRETPSCLCIPGYAEVGKPDCELRTDCANRCQYCTEDRNDCIQCSFGIMRTMDAPECGCRDGYYEQNGGIHCVQCPSQCASCDNQGICIQCTNKNYKLPLCKRTSRAFFAVQMPDGTQNSNQLCDFQCEKCEITSKNCTKCVQGKNRMFKAPECECLPGFQDEDKTQPDCEMCQETCELCSNSKSCDVCKEGLNRTLSRFNGQCECNMGYKPNQVENKYACQRCYQYQNECLIKCPENTILDEKNYACQDKKIIFLDNVVLILLSGLVFIGFSIFMHLLQKIIIKKKYSAVLQKNQEEITIDNEKQLKLQQ